MGWGGIIFLVPGGTEKEEKKKKDHQLGWWPGVFGGFVASDYERGEGGYLPGYLPRYLPGCPPG